MEANTPFFSFSPFRAREFLKPDNSDRLSRASADWMLPCVVGAHTKVRLGKLPFILFAKFKNWTMQVIRMSNRDDSIHGDCCLLASFLLCDLSTLALR